MDLRELFGVGLGPVESPSELVVVGCSAGSEGELLTPKPFVSKEGVHGITLNHWVVGERALGKALEGLVAEKVSAKLFSTSGLVSAADSLHVSAALAGFAVHETQRMGDCGIDTIAWWMGMERTRACFSDIRNNIYKFIMDVADTPLWQNVFRLCEEEFGGRVGPPRRVGRCLRAQRLRSCLHRRWLRPRP